MHKYLNLFFLSIGISGHAISHADDSDCVYEFDQAFNLNESAREQRLLAQRRANDANFKAAETHYRNAIELFQKSINKYVNLPNQVFDCSTANLSIAKNNARIAKDQLELTKTDLIGLDCLQASRDVEALNNLSLEYYHDHKDAESSLQSIQDALDLITTTKQSAVCQGEYAQMFKELQSYTEATADTLKKRINYEQCLVAIDDIEKSVADANLTASARIKSMNWQQIVTQIEQIMKTQQCQGRHLEELIQLKNAAIQRRKEYQLN